MRRWHRVLLFTLLLAAITFLFFHLAIPHKFFDLKIYIAALRWWAGGNELYDYAQPDFLQGELYFTYPPIAAILLFPLGYLPLGVTQTIFTVLTVVAVAVTTKWLMRAAGLLRVSKLQDPRNIPEVAVMQALPRRNFRDIARISAGRLAPGRAKRGVLKHALGMWWLAVPFVLLMEPMRETIMLGQINMLLIVLIMVDLVFLLPRGARWAGAGIGLATALKLFPGIFIVYLLVTRRWRAAIVAMATAAGATLLAAAIAPRASWDFWTKALWDTDRVGRTDYTGNQSLLGLLSRLVAPDEPNRVLWLVLALAVGALGLWRATRAGAAGDVVAVLALTGLVGGLVSPITWPHHLYWFAPALIAVLAAALERGKRSWLWLLLLSGYLVSVLGVVSLKDWSIEPVPTDTIGHFLARNAFVLLSLVLLVLMPIRHYPMPRAN